MRAQRKRVFEAAQLAIAIPNLPFDVVVSHVFREKHLPDPADLAVLRVVSRGMRAAVDATGRKVKEFGQYDAVERGYVSTLKCLRRRGRLSDERLLCAAAARSGDLEALKALRLVENFPWGVLTCANAAKGGHLEVLKWARENGCPWNEWTCSGAAKGGHLEVLKWLRENDCSLDEQMRRRTCSARRWAATWSWTGRSRAEARRRSEKRGRVDAAGEQALSLER